MTPNTLRAFAFAGFALAGIVTPPLQATDQLRTFSFGPNAVLGAFSTNSASVKLNVAGKTLVSVSGSLNALVQPPGGIVAAIPVVIEVFKPEGGPAVATIDNLAAVALVSGHLPFFCHPHL